ncbi:hypothetical protein [Amycolatopsis sp. NPDC051128]|uniref:hypothetical protein n=1 Tax=Amycolatopsis sp. NPDC051128 TaxID=3155412 RepID=UPI00341FDA76
MSTGLPQGHPIVAFLVARAAEVSRADAEKLEEIAILKHYGVLDQPTGTYSCVSGCPGTYPCAPIRQAAARFANHPNYDEAWRP